MKKILHVLVILCSVQSYAQQVTKMTVVSDAVKECEKAEAFRTRTMLVGAEYSKICCDRNADRRLSKQAAEMQEKINAMQEEMFQAASHCPKAAPCAALAALQGDYCTMLIGTAHPVAQCFVKTNGKIPVDACVLTEQQKKAIDFRQRHSVPAESNRFDNNNN